MNTVRCCSFPSRNCSPVAARRRDAAFGTRVTYSPKVFIPLTMLCRDRCGYCTFAKPPARLDAPYLTPDEVLKIARRGAELGCHEALFTLGEAPEARYPDAAEWLAAHGHASTVDYLAHVARLVLDETGLLPHANAGALSQAELEQLRRGEPVAGDDDRDARGAPRRAGRPAPRRARQDTRAPPRHARSGGRARACRSRPASSSASARRARSGSKRSRRSPRHIAATVTCRKSSSRTSCPKPGTAMHKADPCPPDEFLWSIAVARIVLPDDIHLQAPPNLSDDLAPLLAAGIDDWGGVSPAHHRPREPGASVARARHAARARPKPPVMCSRRASRSIPSSCAIPRRGSIPVCAPRCSCAPTAKGSRATPTWSPGRDDLTPPTLLPPPAPARAGGRGRRSARRRARGRGGRRRRDRDVARRARSRGRRRSRRSPTSCDARSSATKSRSSATATSTTRTSARSSAGSARSRRVRCRSTCAASRT